MLHGINVTIRLNAQLFIASTTAVVTTSKAVDDIVRKTDGFHATYATIQEQHQNIIDIF
jgi:hypothetical protein